MAKRDYYEVLGVIKSSSPEEIKTIKLLKQNLKKQANRTTYFQIKSAEKTMINLDMLLLKMEVVEDFLDLIFLDLFQTFLAQIFLKIFLKVLVEAEEGHKGDLMIFVARI